MELVDEGGQIEEPPRRASRDRPVAGEVPSSLVQHGARERDRVPLPPKRRPQLTDKRVDAEIPADDA